MKKIGCFILFFGIFAGLHAQEVQLIDSLFYRGVNAYKAGSYSEALQHLEFMDRVYPRHRRSTGSLLMKGKCFYQLGEYQRAIEASDELLKVYSASSYADDALYGKARALYQLGIYEDAVRTLFLLLQRGGDTRLLHKAANFSSDIMDFRLDIPSLKRLLEVVPDERGQAVLTLRLVQRLMPEGRHQQCKDLLEKFTQTYPQSIYNVEIQQKLRTVNQVSMGGVRFGILLPLTGPFAEQGKSVLAGIKYAVDKQNAAGLFKAELLIRDTRSDILTAIKAAQELCSDKDVVALIGELESDETAAIAAVAQERGVPLLAPTASDQGIADIGSYIFQMSPPLHARAQALAKYAVTGLGLKKFAILAEDGKYGRTMSEAFRAAVEKAGGKILIEKRFYSGENDIRNQFKALREFGIQKMLADSILIRVHRAPVNPRLSGGRQYVDKPLTELVDSTALAVTAFDGLFLPVLHHDLQIVIPQFATNNFDTKVFGGVPWNDTEILEAHRRYIDSSYLDRIVFLSDFYVDPSSFQYNEFVTDYRRTMQRSPGKLDVFGYDAAMLLLSLAAQDKPSRNTLAQMLPRVQNFSGIEGLISFGPDRVNSGIYLMQFTGGLVVPIRRASH